MGEMSNFVHFACDVYNLPVEAVADEDYEEAVDLPRKMHRHLQDGDDDDRDDVEEDGVQVGSSKAHVVYTTQGEQWHDCSPRR